MESLRHEGCQIETHEISETSASGDAVRIGLLDTEAEIRVAAQWARRLIEDAAKDGEPERPIGIIVPDLSQYRSQIERIFGEEFHPNGQLSPELDARRAFNISLGPPLFEYPHL